MKFKQFARFVLTAILVMLSLLVTTPLRAIEVDRTAFTITKYDLDVQIDRTSHVLAATGKLTLRNDSKIAQKLAVLQISSSLTWNGIAANDAPLQWVGDLYTSDIDHTGSLSEAVITLPKEVAPGGEIALDVQYGGTITRDAKRLTRMGAPANVAERNDWDEISDDFTAVRGLGYVAWYPVALDAVSMSVGNEVFDAIAAWKLRHAATQFNVTISLAEANEAAASPGGDSLAIVQNLPDSGLGKKVSEIADGRLSWRVVATAHLAGMGEIVPSFVIGNYVELSRPTVTLVYNPNDTSLARDYAAAAEANDPILKQWLGEPAGSTRIIELADPDANPYQSGATLFTPLRSAKNADVQIMLAPAQVAAQFHSPRRWIEEGLQRFLQTVLVEDRSGRKSALQFLDQYRQALAEAEAANHPASGGSTSEQSATASNNGGTSKSGSAKNASASTVKTPGNATPAQAAAASASTDNSLLSTNDEVYLRGKGGFVFWMLRDMLGDDALQHTLAAYQGASDVDPTYLQKLLQSNSQQHDLEWFFDDWVYRDRGLPEFKVASVYARPLLAEQAKTFFVTVNLTNQGGASAEVPVLVQTPSGERPLRILVKAHETNAGRMEVPIAPATVTVNDGSVPEANVSDNVYQVTVPK